VAGPRFRVWTHAAPAVVLGCAQHAWHAAVRGRLQGRAELLVRESGGGAVLAGPWLVSASVVLPLAHPWLAGGLLASYRPLGQVHVAALQAFGIAARTVSPQALAQTPVTHADSAAAWACFGSLSPWEVVDAGGRKLVGLAQRRTRAGVLLVAGTLLGMPDWHLLCEAMGQPQAVAGLRQGTVSCAELAEQPVAPLRFAQVLAQELVGSLG
jgi:lipoate-protein ligase A